MKLLPGIERPGILADEISFGTLAGADDALSIPIPGTSGKGFEDDGSNEDTVALCEGNIDRLPRGSVSKFLVSDSI